MWVFRVIERVGGVWLVFVWRGWSFSFFGEEETLTLTSGLCYQWLPVVLLAFVAGEQGNGLVLSLRGVCGKSAKSNPTHSTRLGHLLRFGVLDWVMNIFLKVSRLDLGYKIYKST